MGSSTIKTITMSFKTHQNEILIYCNPNTDTSKKVLAYARGVAPYVKEVDCVKTPLTAMQMRGILKQLNLRPKDLMNRAHPYYQENIRGRDFNAEGWLNILIHNPQLLKAPIALRGTKAVLCDNPTNVLKL